jgi:hypothetical protein
MINKHVPMHACDIRQLVKAVEAAGMPLPALFGGHTVWVDTAAHTSALC